MADALKVALLKYLGQVEPLSPDELVEKRYARLRGQGVYRAGS
jgi:hypothetical protein